MKTLCTLGWILILGLSATPAFADACTLSDGQIELNGVSASGGNCILNVKYSFTLKKNNGSKFAYIHFWLTSAYPNPDYKKGPTKDELGDVLATIAISTDDPVSLIPTYPDNNVTPQFGGPTISEVDLGGGSYRITVDNIELTVPGACDLLPEITADVWSTESNDQSTPPIQCLHRGGNVGMPVKLARFNADLLIDHISLSWITTDEAGSSYFDIERSMDAREFVQLARIQAKGNSSVSQQYAFVDNKPLGGNNYYRLRMVDLDGSFEYSRVVAVDNGPNSVAFQLLGNPASNREIRFILKNQDPSQISLFDLTGKSVQFSLSQSGNEFVLRPSGNFPSGLFVLSLQRGNASAVAKKVLIP